MWGPPSTASITVHVSYVTLLSTDFKITDNQTHHCQNSIPNNRIPLKAHLFAWNWISKNYKKCIHIAVAKIEETKVKIHKWPQKTLFSWKRCSSHQPSKSSPRNRVPNTSPNLISFSPNLSNTPTLEPIYHKFLGIQFHANKGCLKVYSHEVGGYWITQGAGSVIPEAFRD